MKMRATRGNCFLPLAEIEIVDGEGRKLPRGTEGRIRARNDFMRWPFDGRLFQDEDAKGDGWFYPGDLGRLDPDGLLIVTGRADEVINAGGVKFSPEAMEDAIKKHPRLAKAAIVRVVGASGVGEPWIAVPIGEPEPPTLKDVNDWINRNVPGELGNIQVVRIVRVEQIPLTSSGKVSRHQLRSMLSASA
jgi:acyl-coenzyme A synthetase/AMP-(fatty) acid ligase